MGNINTNKKPQCGNIGGALILPKPLKHYETKTAQI